MRKYIIILVIVLSARNSFGQLTHHDAKLAGYNIAFGSVVGGIGSMINKHEDQNAWQAFLDGAWKGATGGALTYAGKKMTVLIGEQENLAYAWPAKLVHTTGASMMENAATNKKLLENWAMEISFVRFDVNSNGVQTRLQPFALYGFIKCATVAKLDVRGSISTGNALFYSYDSIANHPVTNGVNIQNSVIYKLSSPENDKRVLNRGALPYSTIGHEIVHSFQKREYLSINSIALSVVDHRAFDFVYPDVRFYSFIKGATDRSSHQSYYKNLFEFEAEYLSEGPFE